MVSDLSSVLSIAPSARPRRRRLLERLHGRTVLGVVTNNQIAEQEEKVAHFGLNDVIDFLVVSEGVGVSKPDPRIFSLALDRAAAEPGEAVMIGDSWENDILGARGAGIPAGLVQSLWAKPPQVAPDPSGDVVPRPSARRGASLGSADGVVECGSRGSPILRIISRTAFSRRCLGFESRGPPPRSASSRRCAPGVRHSTRNPSFRSRRSGRGIRSSRPCGARDPVPHL